MGLCYGRPAPAPTTDSVQDEVDKDNITADVVGPIPRRPSTPKLPKFPFYLPSPLPASYKGSPANSSVTSTPLRLLKRPFPPPSPAKHIRALLARRHGSVKPNEVSIPEGAEVELALDKNFGFSKGFFAKYELGDEVGRGHFGYTCAAKGKKGEMKGEEVAVKVIPKAKMTTAIAIEDVRREVRILSSLTGHKNLVQFYDAFEDEDNVYIVMELCKGGELLDRILSRGGKYSEEDAKTVLAQILGVVSFCHLQGVVHRDLKPENFLFSSREEDATLKVIDFGLSDFVKPDERLNDIVGSAYYVAPEVLHRAYGTEADMWSVGVIAYILLCGSRPFWARTESGIFRAVLKAEPSFDEVPWPSLSNEAKDFVKKLLNKDYRKRMTAAQALCHPWLRDGQEVKIPLDMMVYKLIRAYLGSSSLRKSALRALAKTLTTSQLFYLREQFGLLVPNKSGYISLQNLKTALAKNSTEAMKDSRVLDFVNMVSSLQYRKMDFEEFAASSISVYQLEALDTWEQHARRAYEFFEKEGNRPIMIEELASELGLSPSVPVHVVLQDWIRHSDGVKSLKIKSWRCGVSIPVPLATPTPTNPLARVASHYFRSNQRHICCQPYHISLHHFSLLPSSFLSPPASFQHIKYPNGFILNSVMRGAIKRNLPHCCMPLYSSLITEDLEVLDKYTYSILLHACAIGGCEVEGKENHNHVVKAGFGCDVFVVNTLITIAGCT